MNDMAGSNFVDYVKIFARSGHGGGGSTHFRREKFVAFGGPDGGDGGKGGSIVLQGDKQYWTLIHLKYQRHQFAEDGEHGSGARSSGKDARDIVIPVPLGTVAKRVFENEDGTATTETVGEVTADGERLVLLRGGRGGLGNWHFKSATNQTPRYAQPGEEGEEGTFILELKVLADVGLVGFPNAGKSTLLSVVSAAKPKIADYAFTTLEPNLGIVEVRDHKSFVMADIPGIIEGAHEGRGLGTRFLRHIERNSVLLFLIPADSDDIRRDYDVLLGELTQYNPELLDKERLLAVTKCDMDSTLIETEVIDELAERAGVGDKVREITASAMRGEIDFRESFSQRVALLKGLDVSVMEEIARSLPITEGLERMMTILKRVGYKTAILSGGFTYFGNYLRQKYGFDYVYANELEIEDGRLTGRYVGEVVDGRRKAELLRLLCQFEEINIAQSVAVGDGANDLPMLNLAGLGIAFHAKPKVKATARQSISTIGLDGILYFLGLKDSRIEQ